MKNIVATLILFLMLCVTSVNAQTSAEVQPVPASRDAVMSPSPAAPEQARTDSTGVSIDNQRDAQIPGRGAVDLPAGNSGQPVPSVRKPD
jgi:hypothetical protein